MLYPFNLSFSLSLLFMGFLFANFFGIITSTKSIIFLFIACIELINFFVYTQKLYPSARVLSRVRVHEASETSFFRRILFLIKRTTRKKEKDTKIINYVFIYTLTILNFLKIGFEFGFFVDAFKLGS